MRVAALDLGSNTFLMLIAEMRGDRIEKVISDQTQVTRLGQGVHQSRLFHPDALARADAVLAEFSKQIKNSGCDRVVAVATSAARDVQNGHLLVEMGLRHGIPIQIISGEQEAKITFDGATADLSPDIRAAVIDVGGGSTEVIGLNESRLRGVSFDVGSVRLTELFLPQHPCEKSDLNRLRDYIEQKVDEKKAELPRDFDQVVAVAGTPTSIAMLEIGRDEFIETKIHRFILPVDRIWSWRDRLAALSIEQRQKIPGMQPKRADVLVAGATILAVVTEALGADSLMVSTKGVRYGVARAWQNF